MIELRPIREFTEEYDEIEKKIKELFKKEIYIPLLKEFSNKKKLKNSLEDLHDALRTGRLTFHRGCFSGKLNSTLSGELRKLGAKWNRTKKCYTIPRSDLPYEIQSSISASEYTFLSKIRSIDQKLSQIVPEKLVEKLKIEHLFDRTLWKVEKQFQQSVKNITVAPKLSEGARARLAKEWTNNLNLYIKDFTEKETLRLRETIQKSVFAGNRYETAIKGIQESFGVTARKAKFLARQETALMMTTFKQVRYQEAGIHEYKWRSVKGTPAHPVRPMHKELNDRSDKGEIFRFDQPPVDDPNGGRHNPGQNFNCRCVAIAVVR